MSYEYLSCHALSRQLLAPALRVNNPTWTEITNGISTFEGDLTCPRREDSRVALQAALDPDGGAALYVRSSNGSYPFGGPVVDQTWNRKTGNIHVKAVSWRSWFFNVFLGPKVDLTADNLYGWTQQDQLLIARQIVAFALTGGVTDGRPIIDIGSETSGKLRDLNVKGLDFKYAGELLETISQRAGGFEWGITPYTYSDGLPRLRLTLGFPEIGSLQTGVVLKNTKTQGNMTVDSDEITRSVTDRRTRVWTTGKLLETLPFAVDSDPELVNGGRLLSEKVTAYSSVTERTTLASHARAERQFLNPTLNILPVTIPEGSVDPDAYSAGDRVRLIYRDDWYTLDLPAVRIVERTVTPRAGSGVVQAKLDLSDFEMPDVDEGVTTA